MPGTAQHHPELVPRSPRGQGQVCAGPLLISKSFLHSNRLPAPREANQIKQSGKEDSLFINLTRSPGDLHSRPEILLQLSLDALLRLLVLLPCLSQAGMCQPCTPRAGSSRGTDPRTALPLSDAPALWNSTTSATSLAAPDPAELFPSPAGEDLGQGTALLGVKLGQCQQVLLTRGQVEWVRSPHLWRDARGSCIQVDPR